MKKKILKIIHKKIYSYDIMTTDIFKGQTKYGKPSKTILYCKYYRDINGNIHIKKPEHDIIDGLVFKTSLY